MLWFGNQVGKTTVQAGIIPTYVYPQEILNVVRQRWPDPNAGARDERYAAVEANVYRVEWSDIAGVKWPSPPKTCQLCSANVKKPY